MSKADDLKARYDDIETATTIEGKINAIKAARSTLQLLINSLGTYYNYLQVREWRKKRKLLGLKLKYFKNKLKNQHKN